MPPSRPTRTYTAMKATLARKLMVKSNATMRSAFRADASSSSTSGAGPALPSPSPLPPAASSRRDSAGGGVPITRFGVRSSSPAVALPSALLSSLLSSLLSVMLLLQLRRLLGRDPHRREDEQADPDQPAREAFGDRADAAEAAAARVGLLARLDDVVDDGPLLLGCDRRVVKDRHRLRTGDHRLVDLRWRRVGQRRRELSAGERAARTGEIVALRAVGAEQLAAQREVAALR